eukprot:TRINITY_DN1186_c0_g1_i1.p1 TRINITY_DN1186_c0_g1~~TRINITY_DN1186_c0_g1_i1.p1  ORF type:complete len:151 (+),score=42.75 TRINITY_DN1186_c0_g1_i1:61-453(+)
MMATMMRTLSRASVGVKGVQLRDMVTRTGMRSLTSTPMDPVEKQRRRLMYQSKERGMHENDLLLGTFADKFLATLSADQLTQYDRILQALDPDLFNWISGRTAVPEDIKGDVWDKIMTHVQSNPLGYRHK